MSQEKDHLLQLCKPYLLDLTAVLTEVLRYPENPMYEVLEGKQTGLQKETLSLICDLSQKQQTQVLFEIADWLNSEHQQPMSNAHKQTKENDSAIAGI